MKKLISLFLFSLLFTDQSLALNAQEQSLVDRAYLVIFSTKVVQNHICSLLGHNQTQLISKMTGASMEASAQIAKSCGGNQIFIENDLPSIEIEINSYRQTNLRGWSNSNGKVYLDIDINNQNELILILAHELAVRLSVQSAMFDAKLNSMKIFVQENCAEYSSMTNFILRSAIAAEFANRFEGKIADELGIPELRELVWNKAETLLRIKKTGILLLRDKAQIAQGEMSLKSSFVKSNECSLDDMYSIARFEKDLSYFWQHQRKAILESEFSFYIPSFKYRSGPGPRKGDGW